MNTKDIKNELEELASIEFQININKATVDFVENFGPDRLDTVSKVLTKKGLQTYIAMINPITDDKNILEDHRAKTKEHILGICSEIFDKIYDETCKLAIKSYTKAKKHHESKQN